MIDSLKLKAKLKECGLTQEETAGKMGMNPATLNRKLNNENGENLTVKEANSLAVILKIPRTELTSYFFKEKLANTQEKRYKTQESE